MQKVWFMAKLHMNLICYSYGQRKIIQNLTLNLPFAQFNTVDNEKRFLSAPKSFDFTR